MQSTLQWEKQNSTPPLRGQRYTEVPQSDLVAGESEERGSTGWFVQNGICFQGCVCLQLLQRCLEQGRLWDLLPLGCCWGGPGGISWTQIRQEMYFFPLRVRLLPSNMMKVKAPLQTGTEGFSHMAEKSLLHYWCSVSLHRGKPFGLAFNLFNRDFLPFHQLCICGLQNKLTFRWEWEIYILPHVSSVLLKL